ncbi:MAG: hypothetical protein DLM64_09840 [Solirubrobacterales bacterium]|nr:MAG: hypothetical protein DLM64_09840 [Solirubrobacterales bacterium]
MAAERVALILAAAEKAAEQIRLRAEQQLRERIAEGDRAAQNRVQAAEEEATDIVKDAQQRSRDLLRETRTATSDVRTEGLELIGNLHELGDCLHANAERLLRDMQTIHSQLVAQLDRVDGDVSRIPVGSLGESVVDRGGAALGRLEAALDRREEVLDRDELTRDRAVALAAEGEVLDVPEFVPPR